MNNKVGFLSYVLVLLTASCFQSNVEINLPVDQRQANTKADDFIVVPYIASSWEHILLNDHVPVEISNQNNTILSIDFLPIGTAVLGSSSGLWIYEHGNWISFIAEDGMISNSAAYVSLGEEKDIWIGSSEGISYYDGKNWTTYPLGDVDGLTVGKNGYTWVSYTDKLDDGDIIQKVSYYDGTGWQDFVDLGDARVNRLLAASDGSIWFGTESNGLYELFEGEITQFPIDTFDQYTGSGGVCGFCVGAIEQDSGGMIWAMVAYHGLVSYDGNDWKTIPYFTDGGPKSIAVDKNSRVWVGEVFGNVLAFREDEHWYKFSELPFNKVYSVEIDSDNSVWVGTSEGLFIYRE